MGPAGPFEFPGQFLPIVGIGSNVALDPIDRIGEVQGNLHAGKQRAGNTADRGGNEQPINPDSRRDGHIPCQLSPPPETPTSRCKPGKRYTKYQICAIDKACWTSVRYASYFGNQRTDGPNTGFAKLPVQERHTNKVPNFSTRECQTSVI